MPETFSPIVWHNDQTPAINESNLNRLEVGIEALDDRAAQLELGICPVVTVSFATSVTLNATQGSLFRCVASADLTLDDIVGGTDGQTIVFEVQASGAQQILHFTGAADSVTIAVGQWWVGVFRYVAAGNTWLLEDGSGGGSSGSTNNLNVLSPQVIPYAATVTPNAASGALFRVTAPGDLTLNDPVNGTDGQAVIIEVLASGGQRTITFAGGQTTPIAVPSGTRWTGTLRYDVDAGLWVLADRSDAAGGVGGVSSVNGLTGVVTLDADDLADGSSNVMMLTSERTKLTSVATGATANSTDAQLRNRSTHTGTQTVSTLSTTGTADSTTFLRGDGAWTALGQTTVTANTQTGTSYTLVLGDAGVVVERNNASANTTTVPPNASVAFPVGTVLEVAQIGAGTSTIVAGSGVTIRTPSTLVLRTQYSTAALRKRATNEWVLAGDVQ